MKALYRLIKKPFFGRFEVPWRWPKDADRNDWITVSFESHVGSPLAGLIGDARGRAKGAVVMCHPMGAAAKGFWMRYGHAELLRRAGYHVLLFDLNGFGDSESTHMEYPLDVLAAGLFMQQRYPQLPLGMLGASMGAAAGLCALSQPSHPFKAAVLESTFATLLDFWSHYPLPKLALELTMWVYPAGERRMRPILAAENIQHNPDLLMIYGSGDKYTPVAQGRSLMKPLSRTSRATLWQVDDAEHTHAYRQSPDAYAQKVVGFFDAALDGQTTEHIPTPLVVEGK
ncbi:dipeptidyl aminopeptidase [Bacterioplanes sanyensis]|uniref:Dipeptidyl aminopeptidase n=1 Tax=Bacterioplanes sanyensis TaxID=1249553 RepID=A0A222FIH8_9GAMM|nr:alpha/beta fold hydrolase [Bacterioplanes sanyensis]ASP38559.1 dipeptidyl aminopeptidase [Bacterioplanes sanyensis]